MCFGPSASEKRAAAEARKEAELAKRAEVERRAKAKQEDISEAISDTASRDGMRGGSGRRSLMTTQGVGYLGRFG